MPESVTLEVGGRTMVIETGELAKQANGSALIRYGDQNVVLCAATASLETSRRHRLVPPHLRLRREDVRGRKDSRAATSSAKDGRLSTPCSARVRSTVRFVRSSLKVSETTSRSSRRYSRSIPNSTPTCSASAPRALRSRFRIFRSTGRLPRVRVGRDENGKFIANPTLPQYETGGMEIVVAGTCRRGDDGRRRRQRNFRGRFPRRRRVRARRDQEDRQGDRRNCAKKAGKAKREYPLQKAIAKLEKWVRKDVRERRRQGDAHRREARAQAAFVEHRG